MAKKIIPKGYMYTLTHHCTQSTIQDIETIQIFNDKLINKIVISVGLQHRDHTLLYTKQRLSSASSFPSPILVNIEEDHHSLRRYFCLSLYPLSQLWIELVNKDCRRGHFGDSQIMSLEAHCPIPCFLPYVWLGLFILMAILLQTYSPGREAYNKYIQWHTMQL